MKKAKKWLKSSTNLKDCQWVDSTVAVAVFFTTAATSDAALASVVDTATNVEEKQTQARVNISKKRETFEVSTDQKAISKSLVFWLPDFHRTAA